MTDTAEAIFLEDFGKRLQYTCARAPLHLSSILVNMWFSRKAERSWLAERFLGPKWNFDQEKFHDWLDTYGLWAIYRPLSDSWLVYRSIPS